MSQLCADLPYEELEKEAMGEIQKHTHMVLATCHGGSVSARTMLCIPSGLTLYFITHRNSRKFKQVCTNPNVALADGNLQIEGVVATKGQPLDTENAACITAFREKRPERYQAWATERGHLDNPDMRVVEVTPTRIALYRGGVLPSDSAILVLDIAAGKAYKMTRGDYTKGDTSTF